MGFEPIPYFLYPLLYFCLTLYSLSHLSFFPPFSCTAFPFFSLISYLYFNLLSPILSYSLFFFGLLSFPSLIATSNNTHLLFFFFPFTTHSLLFSIKNYFKKHSFHFFLLSPTHSIKGYLKNTHFIFYFSYYYLSTFILLRVTYYLSFVLYPLFLTYSYFI